MANKHNATTSPYPCSDICLAYNNGPPNTAGQWKKQVAKGYELLSSVKLASGSEWTSTNTLTFRIICKKLGKETMPDFLLPYFTDAKNCVKNSTHMKKLCQVLKAPWRDWSRPELVEAGGVFGVFLCRLAEIRQVEAVVEPPIPSSGTPVPR